MTTVPDPTDARADGAFGGQPTTTSHRAGYSSRALARLVRRALWRGGTAQAGEAAAVMRACMAWVRYWRARAHRAEARARALDRQVRNATLLIAVAGSHRCTNPDRKLIGPTWNCGWCAACYARAALAYLADQERAREATP